MHSSGWVGGLRIFAWIAFVAMIILSIWGGTIVGGGYNGDGVLGFFVFLAGAAISFLAVAFIMVFLDMADDLAAIRYDLSKVSASPSAPSSVSSLAQMNTTSGPKKQCTSCNALYDSTQKSCPKCGYRS